jgi:hypothetical protein
MVILRVVLHLRLLLATAPPSGSAVSIGVSAIAMVIILTVVVVGTVMLAIAARRMATGRRDYSPPARPPIGRARTAGERPVDAWSEAGRRMPVPPPDEGEAQS